MTKNTISVQIKAAYRITNLVDEVLFNSWEKFWAHEVPNRKHFGPTNYPRSHVGTMALDPRDHYGT